ncbi:8104_t:CDS:2, partial [Cetraspora pellucida]
MSMCSAVRRLDLECTRLLMTLTEEQLQKVQEMVDINFGYALEAEQIPEALEFTLEFVNSMLKEESKLDERNKDSPVSVNSPCISIPMVSSNLESDKLEPSKEVKNEKSNLEDSLEGILMVHDALPWKDEHIGVKKDEQLGIEKDKYIRIEKVKSYLMDSILVEELEGYSNSDDNVDTALKKIHGRNSKPKIVFDCESLHEACEKWRKKVNKFKAWMNKVKRTAKHDETYLEPCDQRPKGEKK